MRPIASPTAGLAALLLLASLAACGTDATRDDAHARAGLDDTPPGSDVRHDLGGADCGDPLLADLPVDPAVRAAQGLQRYGMALDGATFSLDLHGEDGDLRGRLRSTVTLELDSATGRAREWRVDSALDDAAGAPTGAAQVLRGRELGEGRIWLELAHRAAGVEVLQWVVLDDALQAERVTLAVAATGGEGTVTLPGGRTYRTLELLDADGARVDGAVVDGWLAEHAGDVFATDAAWALLHAAGTDPGVREAADAHVRLCRAATVDDVEAGLIGARAKARCDAAAGANGGLKCSRVSDIEDGLNWLLTVNDVMGAVGTGATVTGVLVATGVVATGPAIGVAFVAGTVGAVLVNQAIERWVRNNQDQVFDAAFGAGSVVAGGGGREASSFFRSGSVGDPHFDTHDGVAFDFQGAGEFLLVEATEGAPFVVQTRQEPADGVCPWVAVNTGVAMHVAGTRVALYADEAVALHVDGVAVDSAGVLALDGGGTVERVEEERWVVRWPGGERVAVHRRSGARSLQLDVQVALPDHRRGQVRGLLGNFNGDPSDDLMTREGRVLEPPVRWEALTGTFGQSWRISEAESLFDYFGEQSWAMFVNEAFPGERTRIEDLPEEDRAFAERTCTDRGIGNEVAWRACVLDVGCTGEIVFADSHASRTPGQEVEILPPVSSELVTETLPPAPNRILWTFDAGDGVPDAAPTAVSVRVSPIVPSESIGIFQFTSSFGYIIDPVLRFSPPSGATTAADAFALDAWVAFEVEPLDGPVRVERILLAMARGAAFGGDRGLILRTSRDGFAEPLWEQEVLTVRPDMRRYSAPLGILVDRPTTFRLYGYTGGAGQTIEIGDLALDLAPVE
ncbi:MAG: hypothetical protein EA398_01695 [Deltaproteobacteria bacterium]|nr:MAG: hypothetical protein EA398_01695 [Deltaproteobacteria bacterium]